MVSSLLHTLPRLTSLVVLESSLSLGHGTALSLSIPKLHRLRQLELSHTGLGNGGLAALKPGLEEAKELTHLGLANCMLDDEAMGDIEDILHECGKIRVLNLGSVGERDLKTACLWAEDPKSLFVHGAEVRWTRQ